MKKIILVISVLSFVGILFFNVFSKINETNTSTAGLQDLITAANAQIEITIPGCEWRCHENDDECLPGNWISFRACCSIPYGQCD